MKSYKKLIFFIFKNISEFYNIITLSLQKVIFFTLNSVLYVAQQLFKINQIKSRLPRKRRRTSSPRRTPSKSKNTGRIAIINIFK